MSTTTREPETREEIRAFLAEVQDAIEQAMGLSTHLTDDGTVLAERRAASTTRLRELYATAFGKLAIDRFLTEAGTPEARALLGLPHASSN